MKSSVRPALKSKTFSICKSNTHLTEKETNLINYKFYQKSFVLLIAFSTILIFPQSPKELGNICEDYNSIKICNVW